MLQDFHVLTFLHNEKPSPYLRYSQGLRHFSNMQEGEGGILRKLGGESYSGIKIHVGHGNGNR